MAYTLLVVLIVLVAILMIFIVLIQESKGGGLASNFSSTNSIMGVRKTTDIVEKLTWGLAAALVVISVACAYVAPQAAGESSVLEEPLRSRPLFLLCQVLARMQQQVRRRLFLQLVQMPRRQLQLFQQALQNKK